MWFRGPLYFSAFFRDPASLTIFRRESFGKVSGVLYPFVGVFATAVFEDEVACVVDVFEGGEDFAPFDDATFV